MSEQIHSEYARHLDLPDYPGIEEGYLPDNTLVHFHFAPHGIPEHFEGVEALLPESDIIIVEVSGWDERDAKDYKAISKGDQKIMDRVNYNYQKGTIGAYNANRYRTLFGSWKPILFIDQTFEEQKGQKNMSEYTRSILRSFDAADLDEALHTVADLSAEMARKSSVRNRVMVGNLGRKVTDLVTGHPKLKDRSDITVLAPLGFAHEDIYDYLRGQPASEDNVSASSWRRPSGELAIEDQVVEAYMRGDVPTREQLIELMVAYSFSSTPSIMGEGQSMYGRAYRRESDTEYLVSLAAIQLMKDDKAGQALALDRLRGYYTPESLEQFLGYLEHANQQVLEATGQSIDLSLTDS